MYSPVIIEAVTENHAHIIFFGLLNLELFKRAGSYIRYVLYVIYQARSVRMGKKTVPLVLSTARGLSFPDI